MDLFKDIVELAKAGYKPADVKELLSLMKETEPEKKEPEKKEPEKKEPENKETQTQNAFEQLINKEKEGN